jgi:2-C-methyl-D-erythritol 4-phosphate cytidylyltransferase
VIIPAAGIGARFGGKIPKQFLPLKGMPLLIRTIGVFANLPEVQSILVAVHGQMLNDATAVIEDYFPRRAIVTTGGDERQQSVHNSLHHSAIQNADIILVHDAVRPFASANLVRRVIDSTIEFGAAIPALIPKETIKQTTRQGFIEQTFNRSHLAAAQTPQGFKREILLEAYQLAEHDRFAATDDASVVEYAGFPVKVVEGEEDNIKVTTQRDFTLAEAILRERNL